MPAMPLPILPLYFALFLSVVVILAGCGGSREETVAGVKIPIPSGMTKSDEKAVELSVPGFGGGQASYRGNLDPNDVVEFYKKEMSNRGWKPSVGVLSQGGMLTYVKEGKSLIVMVGKNGGGTNMTITVGETKR
ncbi:MAG TPA: hypothetical protein VE616_15495 [Candidatus Udaeobacter sp.]|nr:hypothetical protein [Candidatus Udaeobacter sp.]